MIRNSVKKPDMVELIKGVAKKYGKSGNSKPRKEAKPVAMISWVFFELFWLA
jgi:hypothetical protein